MARGAAVVIPRGDFIGTVRLTPSELASWEARSPGLLTELVEAGWLRVVQLPEDWARQQVATMLAGTV